MQMKLHKFTENSAFPLKFATRHAFLIVRQDFNSYFTYLNKYSNIWFPLRLNRMSENNVFRNKFNKNKLLMIQLTSFFWQGL